MRAEPVTDESIVFGGLSYCSGVIGDGETAAAARAVRLFDPPGSRPGTMGAPTGTPEVDFSYPQFDFLR
jgi:hypothetical protein